VSSDAELGLFKATALAYSESTNVDSAVTL
jgi:hypothetical protein